MSNHSYKTLVIIPAYNEEENIINVIRSIKSVEFPSGEIDICVVNDASSDTTSYLAKTECDVVIDLGVNLGVGGAIRAGFQYARKHKYDYVIQMDADSQHNPKYLPDFIKSLSCNDIVIGSRYKQDFGYPISKVTRVAQLTLRFLIRILYRLDITDPTSGFRASNAKAIELFAEHYPTPFLQDTIGSIILAKNNGLNLIEIPTEMQPRLLGQASYSTLRRTKYFVLSLLLVVFWR